MLNSVISTPGGKYSLRDIIVQYIPKHICWCEPFCGALHIFLAKQKSTAEVINDVDNNIITFFRVLRDNPDELLYKIDMTPYSRTMFNELKAMEPKNDMEKAWRFYCINRMTFGGHRIDKATFGYGKSRPTSFHRSNKIWPLVQRLQDVIIENVDFREFFERYDSEDVLNYLDPPYVGQEHYYSGAYKFGEQDHLDLANILKNMKGKWLLSYNDHSLVRELYRDYHFVELSRYNAICMTKDEDRQIAGELLIANYDIGVIQLPLFTTKKEE